MKVIQCLVIPATVLWWDYQNPCSLDPIRDTIQYTKKAKTRGKGGYNGQGLGRSKTRILMTRQLGEDIRGMELL